MALINWKDEMSVKVAKIDQQHKKLIDLINILSDSMNTGIRKPLRTRRLMPPM
jgi:hemerythrin